MLRREGPAACVDSSLLADMLRGEQLHANLDDVRVARCGMPATRAGGREQGVVGVAELVASAIVRMQAIKRDRCYINQI
jgi:hypothetical protein